jgi:hypothetical protein
MSPSDIFYTDFDGSFTVYATSAFLGLMATDNLNALDIGFSPDYMWDMTQVARLAEEWLTQDCTAENFWCTYKDFDQSGEIDHFDLAFLANLWLIHKEIPEEEEPALWFSCWESSRQCHGDVDGDGWVGLDDLQELILVFGYNYGHPQYNPCCDFNRDLLVDDDDRDIIETYFNSVPPADCPTEP